MEPFTTLSAVAQATETIGLGTAVTVPFRHPLLVSQMFGSIADIAGPHRVVAGIGAGQPRLPFEATGTDYGSRFARTREFAEVLRATFSGDEVSFTGRFFQFDGVRINPPAGAQTPIWYGRSSRGSVVRAAEYCDGWLPARAPSRILRSRLEELAELSSSRAKQLTAAYMPLVSVFGSARDSLPNEVMGSLLDEARGNRAWEGEFDSLADLSGMVISGTPEQCVDQLLELEQLGFSEIILDLRLHFDDYEAQLDLIARDVLPAFTLACGNEA